MEQLTKTFYIVSAVYVIIIFILGFINVLSKKGLKRVIRGIVNVSFIIYAIFSLNIIVTLIAEIWCKIIEIAE